MQGKLTYRFEGMTEMVNGAFMDDLGELLSSATGQQRKPACCMKLTTRKNVRIALQECFNYQITHALPSLMLILRQTMIRELRKVGKDKEAWKKAEKYLTKGFLSRERPFWSTGTVACTESGGPEFESRSQLVVIGRLNCCSVRTAYVHLMVANATAT